MGLYFFVGPIYQPPHSTMCAGLALHLRAAAAALRPCPCTRPRQHSPALGQPRGRPVRRARAPLPLLRGTRGPCSDLAPGDPTHPPLTLSLAATERAQSTAVVLSYQGEEEREAMATATARKATWTLVAVSALAAAAWAPSPLGRRWEARRRRSASLTT
jgi:hypothetical protein